MIRQKKLSTLVRIAPLAICIIIVVVVLSIYLVSRLLQPTVTYHKDLEAMNAFRRDRRKPMPGGEIRSIVSGDNLSAGRQAFHQFHKTLLTNRAKWNDSTFRMPGQRAFGNVSSRFNFNKPNQSQNQGAIGNSDNLRRGERAIRRELTGQRDSRKYHILRDRLRNTDNGLGTGRRFRRPKDSMCNKLPWNKDFPCRTVQPQPGLNIPVCTYKSSDNSMISESVNKGMYWEWRSVSAIIEQLKKHPQAEFIDIGAHIGTYTLAVVHALRRQTVAVEPNPHNVRRLAVAACYAGVFQHLTILRRAISDSQSSFSITSQNKLPEQIYMHQDTSSCVVSTTNPNCRNRTITVITLGDLVGRLKTKEAVLKVDANGNELKIFSGERANYFFSRVKVQAVLLDLKYYQEGSPHSIGSGKDLRQKMEAMLKFFIDRQYKPRRIDDNSVLTTDWVKWPPQVLFVKSDNKITK